MALLRIFIYVDEQGLNIAKVLSTPDNPAHAVLTGLRQLSPSLTDVNIVHGSTVATNALLECKGVRTAIDSSSQRLGAGPWPP